MVQTASSAIRSVLIASRKCGFIKCEAFGTGVCVTIEPKRCRVDRTQRLTKAVVDTCVMLRHDFCAAVLFLMSAFITT